MAGNTFGEVFKITTCGESHGGAVAVIVDGCPPLLSLTEDDIQYDLDRRRPGQSHLTSPRKEEDKIQILSGVFQGKTTGAPILLLAYNKDMRPEDYSSVAHLFRPSHADYTYQKKYGIRDHRGSGRASARETLARVAAGAIAKKLLKELLDIEILSYVEQIANLKTKIDHRSVTREAIESNLIRCPDETTANQMIHLIESVKSQGNSIGGIIRGIIRGVPPGLGEPVFDKLNADLGKAMLSINAVKGFDIGSGFEGIELLGSQHNDPFTIKNNQIALQSNYAGGTLGGISTGADIYFRVVFKPVSTISQAQDTVTMDGKPIHYSLKGRHDPCVLPRAVPVVDAMAALVILDHYLRQKAVAVK